MKIPPPAMPGVVRPIRIMPAFLQHLPGRHIAVHAAGDTIARIHAARDPLQDAGQEGKFVSLKDLVTTALLTGK
jgi:hypothetical protein